jgi:3-oxoadipate enol-lactonase
MRAVTSNGLSLHVSDQGRPDGPAVVFANSLGTDLRLWDALLPHLPQEFRYVRFDLRGHGLTECPQEPYSMADLAGDAAGLIEALDLGPVVFVGLSIGGMIGQKLAADRPDLVRALVLSNTAAKMGETEMWQTRIAAIRDGGLASMEGPILDRWFGPVFRNAPAAALWGAMLTRTPVEGYLGCCAAIAATDLTVSTKALKLPTLTIAGSDDGASPPDLVQATADLIDGATSYVIDGVGHLPCVENPQAYAAILTPFLKEHAHD